MRRSSASSRCQARRPESRGPVLVRRRAAGWARRSSRPRTSTRRRRSPPSRRSRRTDLRRRLVAARPGAVLAPRAERDYGMHRRPPRHRGRAPIPWAILSGLAKTGVTLFEITDPTADSGPIVGQVEIPIAPDETATTLFDAIADGTRRADPEGVPLISPARHRASPGRATRELVAEANAARRDHRLGDARAVSLRLGARPDPALSRRVHVGRRREGRDLARRAGGGRAAAPAGTIVERRPEGPVVACGDGAFSSRKSRHGARSRSGRCSDEPHPRDRRAPGRRGARDGRDDRPARRRSRRRRPDRLRHRRSSTSIPGDAEIRAQKEEEAAPPQPSSASPTTSISTCRTWSSTRSPMSRSTASSRSRSTIPARDRLHRAPRREPRPPRAFDSVAVATRPVPGQPVRRVLTYAPTSAPSGRPRA